MKIRELTNKAENLIEQGENAKQRQMHYQQQANSARAQVMSAYARLEAAASETDEEGNPTGDVSGARAEVYAAQALLESAEAGLDEANQQLEGIGRRKMDAVHEIERYEAVEEGNMSKLAELQNKRFGANANAFMADLAARMNSGEQARLQLLASMGIAASAKSFSGGTVSGSGASGGTVSQVSQRENNDVRTFFGSVFARNRTEREQKTRFLNFNGFSLECNGMAGDRYFVKGNNYDRFSHFWQNSDQYTHSEARYRKTINARDIEGIYLNENEANDSHLFWNRGKEYDIDSETYFMEVASNIPEVRSRLEAGESIDSIRSNPKLKTCYDYYFDSPIEVYEVDDFYYFAGAGRHRCMAAQKLGYDIPVNVIGTYKSQSITRVNVPENLMLATTNYSSAFTNSEREQKNTQKLVDYVNSLENSDKRVVNLYNSIGKIENLQQHGIQFSITHDNDHAVKESGIRNNGNVRTTEIVLTVPELSGDNITGQVQTTLHEQMHLVDKLLKKDVGDFYAPGFAAANEGMKKTLQNTTSDIGEPVQRLFDEHSRQFTQLRESIRQQYDTAISAAKDQLSVDGDFGAYLERVNKAKENADSALDYHARNLMQGGIGQLEDIYDALSGGTLFDSHAVCFGHGSKYYQNDESRIDEIIANYASLSVTRPDLVSLLKQDKPMLVASLDNIIDMMNERVMNNG